MGRMSSVKTMLINHVESQFSAEEKSIAGGKFKGYIYREVDLLLAANPDKLNINPKEILRIKNKILIHCVKRR